MTREAKLERTAEKYAEGNPNAILMYRAFKDGAEWADNHPAKKQAVTIDAWAVRDWTGLYLSDIKPQLKRSYPGLNNLGYLFFITDDEKCFPSIKDTVNFGEPRKVKVTIELEDE